MIQVDNPDPQVAGTLPSTISVNSASPALKITQAGAGDALVVEDVASDTTPFAVDQYGQVRIGSVGGQPANTKLATETSSGIVNRTKMSQAGVGSIGIVMPASVGAMVLEVNDTERLRIDADGLITGTGTSLGAWTAYTPTLGGTGWAIGDGTVAGYYCQIGKIVHFQATITFGASSTYGAGEPAISLPVSKHGHAPNGQLRAHLVDMSAGALYTASSVWLSSTTAAARTTGTNGLLAAISSTAPFTWAVGDSIALIGMFEAA